MPLEMFTGKTGERLIARAPVGEGSYADVTISTAEGATATIRLNYAGGQANGYPALSPTLGSLETAFGDLARHIPVIREGIERRASEWEDVAAKHSSTSEQDDDHVSLSTFLVRWWAEDAATYLRRMGAKPPICPRVMVGEILQLRLPKIYDNVSAVDLGTVQKIDIVNA